jgi:hypothetical protein
MRIQDFFLNSGSFIFPRTPAGALRAFEGGFAPIEAFIYKSSSTKPMDEEPYDFEEIERILSRPNLDFRTNVVLMGIFEKLIHREDQEMALFAAESINVIENRYNAKIGTLKKLLAYPEFAETSRSELGRVFFELALLNGRRQAIKEFYIRQSVQCFKELLKLRPLSSGERNTFVRALMEDRDYESARNLLNTEPVPASTGDLFLVAEIEYSQKKFDRAAEIISRLVDHMDQLSERDISLYAYWMGA